jgi:hypothetical protein
MCAGTIDLELNDNEFAKLRPTEDSVASREHEQLSKLTAYNRIWATRT